MTAGPSNAECAVAAIVLAAGQGKRMKSALPKVLHKVCGAPLIHFPLEALGEGFARRVVVLGVGREQVEAALKDRPGLEFATQTEPLGTGHAVLAAKPALEGFQGDIVVLPGDAPCITAGAVGRLLERHRAERADATVVTAECCNPAGYGRIIRDGEGRIAGIIEERDATDEERGCREVNASMYAFRAAALWPALERVRPDNAAGEIYLTDVVRILIAGGRTAATVEVPFDEIEGVNDRSELADADMTVRWRTLDRLMASGVTFVDPNHTYVEIDVEIGADTTVEPFTVIRRGARIGAGCHIGPFAHVAEGAVLEDGAEIGNFVEVKRTRMRRRAKAKHLAYLGDGDVGEGANIGAGTIFCNYDGKAKHRTSVGARAFVGSGSLLVAPVEIGDGATTGAGAVVTRGKRIPAGETWVGVPARPLGKRAAPGTGTGSGTGMRGG